MYPINLSNKFLKYIVLLRVFNGIITFNIYKKEIIIGPR